MPCLSRCWPACLCSCITASILVAPELEVWLERDGTSCSAMGMGGCWSQDSPGLELGPGRTSSLYHDEGTAPQESRQDRAPAADLALC